MSLLKSSNPPIYFSLLVDESNRGVVEAKDMVLLVQFYDYLICHLYKAYRLVIMESLLEFSMIVCHLMACCMAFPFKNFHLDHSYCLI